MNAQSLSGVPLNVVPPTRIQKAGTPELHIQLQRQIIDLLTEVGNIHAFSEFMEDHGDETLQGALRCQID